MLISAIFYFLGIVLLTLITPLVFFSGYLFTSGIAQTISSGLDGSFDWLFGSVLYFGGIFPVNDILMAINFLLLFFAYVYFVRFIFWLISMLPFMQNVTLPFARDAQNELNPPWKPTIKITEYKDDNRSTKYYSSKK